MKKVINHFMALFIGMVTIALLMPLNAYADNRVITGPQEAYSSRAQECVFRLNTDYGWRAECDYSYIHVSTSTGGSGESELRFTIDENTSPDSRMGWIVLYDKRMYYPIFTFEINQAGANSAPPAVGPYFTNEVAALDDGYEAISWDTPSFTFKFMSNRNVTMKVNGSAVSLTKTRNNNGYTYTYILNMGVNETANARNYQVEVNVDGTNVSGGNHHIYRVAQRKIERFVKDVKIVGGMVTAVEGASHGRPLQVRYTTNDDLLVWLSWESILPNQYWYTNRVSPVTTVNIGSQNYAYGTTGTVSILCWSPEEMLPIRRRNVVLHVRGVNSSIQKDINVVLNHDYGY